MQTKLKRNQGDSRRLPQQLRALEKIELILESSRRILERDGLEGFTTNHVAELAGVSIGTLYQYFPNKRSVLDELAGREIGSLTQEVMSIITSYTPTEPGERIRALIRAVVRAYGGRTGVHRVLMQYVLAQGGGSPLTEMRNGIIEHMKGNKFMAGHEGKRSLNEAEAFVITYAVDGVLRGILYAPAALDVARCKAIEDELVLLALNYFSR